MHAVACSTELLLSELKGCAEQHISNVICGIVTWAACILKKAKNRSPYTVWRHRKDLDLFPR